MEASCIVFPAPKQFSFGRTIKKILLVPRQRDEEHTYYHQQLLGIQDQNISDFDLFLGLKKKRKKENFGNKSEEEKKINNQESGSDKNLNKTNKHHQAMKHLLESHYSSVTQESLPKVSEKQYIPCTFIRGMKKKKIMIFFHANGEDISSSFQFASSVCCQLNISILSMEYQGYSIYSGQSSPNTIIQDAIRVIEFLLDHGIQEKDIILVGRSIGGSMTFVIGSVYQVSSIILLSPFLSLKRVASDLYGSCSSTLLKESFNNQYLSKNIKSPLLLIHGIKDQLVPYEHSLVIMSECKSFCRLHLIENMTHSKFSFRRDFLLPVRNFLSDLDLLN